MIYSRLSAEEQVCSYFANSLHEMSTQVRRELEIIPAQVKVKNHVRYVYSCRHCENNEIEKSIITAKMHDSVFPGSLASPSAMAHTMAEKYVEGMPLYRQTKHLACLGIFIQRIPQSNRCLHIVT